MNNRTYKIAICDDSISDRENTRSLCELYFSSHNIDVCYFEYFSGTSFLKSTENIDLLFLDIELGDMNGIDVMKQLETRGNVWKIIFTTSHDHYMPDAFGSKTLGFLVKPVSQIHLERYLTLFQKELILTSSPEVVLPNHRMLALADILYIESSGSYYRLFLASTNEMITCSGSVKDFISSLNTNIFVCINRGTYINLYHVTGNTDNSVTLSNGESMPIRSRFFDDFKAKLIYFIRNYRR